MGWSSLAGSSETQTAPVLRLPRAGGGQVALGRAAGRSNRVLVFVHGRGCAACRRLVGRLVQSRAELAELQAEVLIISPDGETESPFPVLVDGEGKARRAYSGLLPEEGDVLIFVLDRFGAAYAGYAGPEEDAEGQAGEVLEWLEFIELQCPECGIPEW